MAIPSDQFQRLSGFFHAGGQVSFTRQGSEIYEATVPSAAILFGADIAVPPNPFPTGVAADATGISNYAAANPGVLRQYVNFPLTPVAGSNNQAYFIDDAGNGGRQAPIMIPQFAVDPLDPSQVGTGFGVFLRGGTNGTIPGTPIGPGEGVWFVQPDEGIIHFEQGFTPVDPIGINNDIWGNNLEISCWVYTGPTLASGGSSAKVDFSFSMTDTVVIPNITDFIIFEVWIQIPPSFSGGPSLFNTHRFNTTQFGQVRPAGPGNTSFFVEYPLSAVYDPVAETVTITLSAVQSGFVSYIC